MNHFSLRPLGEGDEEAILRILTDEELFERISECGQDPNTMQVVFTPGVDWLGIFENDDMIGCYLLHRSARFTAVVHINILKGYRQRVSKEAVRMFYDWLLNNSDIQKLETTIPVIYKNVFDYVIWAGWTLEGVSRNSLFKDEMLVDQYIMGITRDEIQDWMFVDRMR